MAERPGTRKPVILAVDDSQVLRAVERGLRRYTRECRLIRAVYE
jgi:hypothetical protein